MGLWYDYAHKPNNFQEGECATAVYGLKSDGTISVFNREFLREKNEVNDALGSASCSKDVSGSCVVSFSKFAPKGDYRVVSTDYTSYSIVYSCSQILSAYNFELIWILSRKVY